MILLLYLTVAGTFYLWGKAVLRTECYWEDNFLVGGILCVGLTETVHLGTLLLHRTFSDGVVLFFLLWGLSIVASILLIVWRGIHGKAVSREHRTSNISLQTWSVGEKIIFAVFFLLALWQVIFIATGQQVYLRRDMTAETVNSFLASDSIYQVNPMTGQPYELGAPLRLKILCLPTLYAILCKTFGLSAIQVVWGVVPAITLLLSYLAYSLLARRLFPKDRLKRGCFLALAALLFWVGDYAYGMDGFGLLHGGFWGVTIRGTVLVPYAIGLVLRRRWKLVILCILAEACIVWTFYGMGACVLVAAGLFSIEFILKYLKNRKGEKEETVCENS